MAHRWIFVAILGAAIGGLTAISYVPGAAEAGLEPTVSRPFSAGLVVLVLFVLAARGNRPAWGVTFALTAIAAGLSLFVALAEPTIALRWSIAAGYVVVALALWGLKPEEPAVPRNQG